MTNHNWNKLPKSGIPKPARRVLHYLTTKERKPYVNPHGFLKSGGRLSAEEIRLFPAAARIITIELAARFLTDYLNGNVYFKAKKSGHNLIRTRNQIKLVRQMEEVTPAMEAVVAKYAPSH